jgi:hypothetical protein
MVTSYVDGSGGSLFGGVAEVTFTDGAPGQVDADIQVLWDFDNDGDFSEPVEDITGFVMAAESVSGRDWPSNLQGKAAPGTLQLTLDNSDDRFSHFNADSPLNQGDNSLATGRKIRVQASGATNPDPVLLARDRFRQDGLLAFDEMGNTWTNQQAGFTKDAGRATLASTATAADFAIATVDITDNDHYVQVTSEFIDTADTGTSQAASLVYRLQDVNNYGALTLSEGELLLETITAGVGAVVATYDVETNNHQHCTFGVHAHGTVADVYLEGVLIASGTAASFTGGEVGMRVLLWQDQLRFPAIEEFHVYDGVPVESDEVVWTGDVASVIPSATVGALKTAMVTAEGRLARAANVEVEVSPSAGQQYSAITGALEEGGRQTGVGVGHVLNRAGLATPPGFIDEGDILTGSFGFPPGNALELARQFEEAELGFLYEAPEGWLNFTSRSARSLASSTAGFTDGDNAQFGYSELTPFDWRKEVVNQVSAGLASARTTGTQTNTGNSTGAGVDNNITFGIPTVMRRGDLMIVIIAATVRATDRGWAAPTGWTALRDPGDQSQGFTMGIYYKIAKDNDGGQTISFLNDASAGGVWQVNAFRITEWYGTAQGIEIGTVSTAITSWGDTPSDAATPPALAPSWGIEFPTLFIACMAGWQSTTGGITYPDPQPPSGYNRMSDTVRVGTADNFDVALATAGRSTCTALEAPTAFNPFSGSTTTQSVLLAVRGRNGPAPTLQTANQTLTSGPLEFYSVEANDFESQDRHGGSPRTYRNPSRLFKDETDLRAYNDLVLATYADDRPIFSLSYWATISANYRAQALARRVGDKITLTANGDTGMGVAGEFFIEKVSHSWTEAAKRWRVTYELSPA